jgi:hopanoid biosynthesis associated protein HpnK
MEKGAGVARSKPYSAHPLAVENRRSIAGQHKATRAAGETAESQRPVRVILNADDFGSSSSVNAAVIEAHRRGVLTSASLMVAGAEAGEAVALARATPTLAVGLHLVAVDGPAALPRQVLPHLLDRAGRFPDAAVRLGVRYVFDWRARRELAREMEAQFESFAATGLPFSHVDGQQHMHMHPVVFDLLVPLAIRYGVRGVRVPADDLRLGLRYDRRHIALKSVWWIAFGLLGRRNRARLAGSRLVTTQRVYGLMQSGHMDVPYTLKVLEQLPVATAELYFHPDTRSRSNGLGPNQGDLATLLSPAVARAIQARGFQLATYDDLAENEAF